MLSYSLVQFTLLTSLIRITLHRLHFHSEEYWKFEINFPTFIFLISLWISLKSAIPWFVVTFSTFISKLRHINERFFTYHYPKKMVFRWEYDKRNFKFVISLMSRQLKWLMVIGSQSENHQQLQGKLLKFMTHFSQRRSSIIDQNNATRQFSDGKISIISRRVSQRKAKYLKHKHMMQKKVENYKMLKASTVHTMFM